MQFDCTYARLHCPWLNMSLHTVGDSKLKKLPANRSRHDVGANEGRRVGDNEGLIEGDTDGDMLGAAVGLVVGDIVGAVHPAHVTAQLVLT